MFQSTAVVLANDPFQYQTYIHCDAYGIRYMRFEADTQIQIPGWDVLECLCFSVFSWEGSRF